MTAKINVYVAMLLITLVGAGASLLIIHVSQVTVFEASAAALEF